MILRHLRIWLAVVLLSLSATAAAHRFHTGITELAYNPRSNSTEIVHTYMAHDIENLLMNIYGRPFDLGDPEDQEVLRKYVESRFWLEDKSGARLPVRWVGMQANPENILIYQELENAPLSKTATIHQGVLIDFLPDQVNTVNLNEAGKIRSLTFTQSNLEQENKGTP